MLKWAKKSRDGKLGGKKKHAKGEPVITTSSSSSSKSKKSREVDLVGSTVQVEHMTVSVVKKIAEGGFAFVFLAKEHGHHSLLHHHQSAAGGYALKRVYIADDYDLPQAVRELQILKSLPPHKNIVRLFAGQLHQEPGQACHLDLLFELAGGGALVDEVNAAGQFGLSEQHVLDVFQAVCEAVHHLHSQSPPIVHRDLKLENVLLGGDGLYKLCDFGSATTDVMFPESAADMQRCDEEIQRYTTLMARAPEMIDFYRERVVNFKSDVWALGVLLYRLAFFYPPFEDNKLAILNNRYDVPAGHPYSPALVQLVAACLHADPGARPDLSQLLHQVAALRGVPCPVPVRQFPDDNHRIAELLAAREHSRQQQLQLPDVARTRGQHLRSASAGPVLDGVQPPTSAAINYADRHREKSRPSPSAPRPATVFDLLDPASITFDPASSQPAVEQPPPQQTFFQQPPPVLFSQQSPAAVFSQQSPATFSPQPFFSAPAFPQEHFFAPQPSPAGQQQQGLSFFDAFPADCTFSPAPTAFPVDFSSPTLRPAVAAEPSPQASAGFAPAATIAALDSASLWPAPSSPLRQQTSSPFAPRFP